MVTMGSLARLPEDFSFASAPVLVSGGSEAVALLEPTEAGFGGSPLRLGETSSFKPAGVTVGPVVAGNTATLFTGSGQVFLLNLFGTPIGPRRALESSEPTYSPSSSPIYPSPKRRPPSREFGPTNPAIADAWPGQRSGVDSRRKSHPARQSRRGTYR